MGKIPILVDFELVDQDLNPIESTSARFLELTGDELAEHEVTIEVNNRNMVPTAMVFCLRKRPNTTIVVNLAEFPGSDFVYSFLMSSQNIGVVNYEKRA